MRAELHPEYTEELDNLEHAFSTICKKRDVQLYYKGTSVRSNRQRLLKRTFHLQRTMLDDIIHEFIYPRRDVLLDLPHALRDLPSEVADNLLISLLAESRDNVMRDIVRSIQEQQYGIISAPEEKVLVVQGVDGSGEPKYEKVI